MWEGEIVVIKSEGGGVGRESGKRKKECAGGRKKVVIMRKRERVEYSRERERERGARVMGEKRER